MVQHATGRHRRLSQAAAHVSTSEKICARGIHTEGMLEGDCCGTPVEALGVKILSDLCLVVYLLHAEGGGGRGGRRTLAERAAAGNAERGHAGGREALGSAESGEEKAGRAHFDTGFTLEAFVELFQRRN